MQYTEISGTNGHQLIGNAINPKLNEASIYLKKKNKNHKNLI